MSMLNNVVMAPAWTTVLPYDAQARRWRPYAAPRYLKSWDQLMFLEEHPPGSILYEWDGKKWTQPPYLSTRRKVSGASSMGRYEVQRDCQNPKVPYAGIEPIARFDSFAVARLYAFGAAKAYRCDTLIWDWSLHRWVRMYTPSSLYP